MDEDIEPASQHKPAPKNLDELSMTAIRDYIAALKAEIKRAEAAVVMKQTARIGADAVFKS